MGNRQWVPWWTRRVGGVSVTAIDIYKQAALEDGWPPEDLSKRIGALLKSKSPLVNAPIPQDQERQMIEGVKRLYRLPSLSLRDLSKAIVACDKNQ